MHHRTRQAIAGFERHSISIRDTYELEHSRRASKAVGGLQARVTLRANQ